MIICLLVLYRLDRLTSGLVILPRNLITSQKMEQQLRDKLVAKEYICRVEGEFPRFVSLFFLQNYRTNFREPITVDKPIDIVSHKMGLYRISDSGKESLTKFELLWTNGQESVVKCKLIQR